jgi:hypothetical protein
MGSVIGITICILLVIIGGIYLSKGRWVIMRLRQKIEDKFGGVMWNHQKVINSNITLIMMIGLNLFMKTN